MSHGVDEELARAGIAVLERGWLSSNNVVVRGDADHGAAVIDTGYWIHGDQTVALLRHALAGEPLTTVVNTHLHSDHCGGNVAVQRAFGCAIDIPAGEASRVAAWDEDALTYKPTGQHCPRFMYDGLLTSPGTRQIGRWSWQVTASPGHDPKSVALYQPDLQILVSADALWENGFGVVFPELEGESAFDDVARTLDAFSRLKVRMVLPGHGRAFTDIGGAIERARRRLDGFIADPRKHTLHAVKVLMKFRLLETQSEPRESFFEWAENSRYFRIAHEHHFHDVARRAWFEDVLGEMCHRGILRRRGEIVENAD